MKYYFITYRGDIRSEIGKHSTWNQCIDMSPMKYIKQIEKSEEQAHKCYYLNFVVLNTCEISKEEFEEFDGHF